jgi:hypothetical protein
VEGGDGAAEVVTTELGAAEVPAMEAGMAENSIAAEERAAAAGLIACPTVTGICGEAAYWDIVAARCEGAAICQDVTAARRDGAATYRGGAVVRVMV